MTTSTRWTFQRRFVSNDGFSFGFERKVSLGFVSEKCFKQEKFDGKSSDFVSSPSDNAADCIQLTNDKENELLQKWFPTENRLKLGTLFELREIFARWSDLPGWSRFEFPKENVWLRSTKIFSGFDFARSERSRAESRFSLFLARFNKKKM